MTAMRQIATILTMFLCIATSDAYAQHGSCSCCDAGPAPYGSACRDRGKWCYGRPRVVADTAEAQDAVVRYYQPRRVKVGSIIERHRFYIVTVTDEAGHPVDTIAVDRRNGRIRSIQ